MNRKEKIINTALKLFAKHGFNATSTSKIAKEAKVSEGLIFSHFKNKEGLLLAITELGKQNFIEKSLPIINNTNPKDIIRQVIEMPFKIPKSEYDFWALQFQLKWNTKYYNSKKHNPLKQKVKWAFTELKLKDPTIEAQFLIDFCETILVNILRDGKQSQLPYEQYLLQKYKL